MTRLPWRTRRPCCCSTASGTGKTGTARRGWAGRGRAVSGLVLHRAEIDQATGMLTVQLDVPVADAFARLCAYAYAHDRRLADVARDIVARRLRLHGDRRLDGGP